MQWVEVENIKEGMVLAQPIFLNNSNYDYLTTGFILKEKHMKLLANLNIAGVYISINEKDIYKKIPKLNHITNFLLRDTYISTYLKLDTFFNQLINSGPVNVKTLYQATEDIMSLLQIDDSLLLEMTTLKSYDYYSITHSINVCGLALFLGNKLQLSKEKLYTLGVGALLHDIGKIDIPNDILNKNQKLNDKEFAIMKRHSEYGYERIKNIVNEEIAQIVLHHHEACNGAGYPMKLKGKEIDDLTKCVSVADVYDAVTTDRCYRKKMAPHEGIEVLLANVTLGILDWKMVMTFFQHVRIYPDNCMVKLNDDSIARVKFTSPDCPIRPTLEIVLPVKERGKIVHLIEHPTLFIVDFI
jgi:HD-GYP domain-containing protein (c-di-GMP phosphodiesterase class II)